MSLALVKGSAGQQDGMSVGSAYVGPFHPANVGTRVLCVLFNSQDFFMTTKDFERLRSTLKSTQKG